MARLNLVDCMRIFSVACAFWMFLLLLVAHIRRGFPHDRIHTSRMLHDLSYGLLMVVIIARRIQLWGTPATWATWAIAVVLAIGVASMLLRFEFTLTPWRRQKRQHRSGA